ncbi:hypothetical protein Pr1d_35770 [Bythopirellula goksoeyrii]|uniref:Uncharacterized protein n=1 Tax=Bythopirellula goksoeyrii TaxID=1400387 RepID=A0A5B9QF69_9BACT|nr:hypothetical protein Pr1d_35770 [Bythopirellula goksoeyrii]
MSKIVGVNYTQAKCLDPAEACDTGAEDVAGMIKLPQKHSAYCGRRVFRK